MQVTDKLYTTEEFREFENRPENAAKNFELINGVMVEMPRPSMLHNWIITHLIARLVAFLATNNLGEVFTDSIDCDLAPGVVLNPDVCFIAADRIETLTQEFNGSPDLAVEVVSPSNTATEMFNKVSTYIKYGTQIVWVIYPDDKTVLVYRPGGDGSLKVHSLTANDVLDGGTVLPGFSVKVDDLFPKFGKKA